MKPNLFLKDKAAAYLIRAGAWLVAVIFMAAYHIQTQAVVIISIIMITAAVLAELLEFMRKNKFYSSMVKNTESLDKKYLLPEMLEEPDFYEGRLFYDSLRQTNRSMCERIAEYRRKSTEFREYIEMWVHEIKLPVASLSLMCHNDSNPKYEEQLRRIDSYIENVLYYARSGNAEKDYIIKDTSLMRIFSEAALKNRSELQQRGVSIETKGLDVNVLTDGKWLSYILGQLMSNSMKYFSESREAELCVYAIDSADKTVLHFRDNGIGIPESDLPYIFEKSFTGENGRLRSGSTGMGLYITRSLCEKLGHSIAAESVQGGFTDISITFGKNDYLKLS